MGVRREARERALGLLYETEIRACSAQELLTGLPVEPDAYAVELFLGVEGCTPELDALIGAKARHWSMGRMASVDRALLRIAVYELVHHPEVPVAVVINESVELAKLYSTEDSGRFVNGVLGAVAEELRRASRAASTAADGSPPTAAGGGSAR